VILAHGPWFDASLWHSVILPLHSGGLQVLVAPLPFTTFEDDVLALRRTIERTRGPLLIVAHSYAGAVASAGGPHDRVIGRIYLSGLAPPPGRTIGQMLGRDSSAAGLRPNLSREGGFIWANREQYRSALAPSCMPHQWAILEATQRPIAEACLNTAMPEIVLGQTRVWFLISEQDRVIPPSIQIESANRLGARTISKPVDHAVPLADPDCVVETILEVVRTTLGERAGSA